MLDLKTATLPLALLLLGAALSSPAGAATEFLATSAPIEPLAIPPSGTLAGSSSPWQGSNVTAKYTWRLVPE